MKQLDGAIARLAGLDRTQAALTFFFFFDIFFRLRSDNYFG